MTPEQVVMRMEAVALLHNAMQSLQPRSRILLEWFAEGMTLTEAGSRFGISRERARQVAERACSDVRRYLGAYGLFYGDFVFNTPRALEDVRPRKTRRLPNTICPRCQQLFYVRKNLHRRWCSPCSEARAALRCLTCNRSHCVCPVYPKRRLNTLLMAAELPNGAP